MTLAIGTLVDDPAGLPEPRPALMKRMCAGRPGRECGLVLGWVVCVPAMAGQVSHGACECCAEAASLELEELLALEGAALEDILDGRSARPMPQATTPDQAEAIAGAGEVLARPAVHLLCAPGASANRIMTAYGTGDTAGADGGRISLVMEENYNQPPASAGLSVQAVAEATGLSRAEIYRAAGLANLGAPAHFGYPGGQLVYTPAGLHQMANALASDGQAAAAEMLRMAARAREAAADTRPLNQAPAEHWLERTERRKEEDAA